ncbi:hypothetical protein [Aliidiomarina sanyensis]|uniref:Uncharacterized protein n=1 Tax=Aliidiomarina sanyensis TaxID=1249555 RepID=A0A432WRD8_9GAMM|nr:hypothetical protein [Aliidiomarina sanyensis]RUO36353.1 hypothetical protein CWE11_00590 [Aliidiomarina sanyensis]
MNTQSDIFSYADSSNLGLSAELAELCNTLYDSELKILADTGPDDPRLLKRRLGSLSHYVRRAAHALIVAAKRTDNPLQFDVQNACWLSRQRPHAPLPKLSPAAWLQKHVQLAMPLPVWERLPAQQGAIERIRLDTVDEIDITGERVHLNQTGWFHFSGDPEDPSSDVPQRRLLRPDKASMVAACAGHRWGPTGRLAPQTLSLRELLLTTTVSWTGFSNVQRLPF